MFGRPGHLAALGLALTTLGAAPAVRAQGAADTVPLDVPADVWRARYLLDLDSARAIIADDHPGAVDAKNPAFARTLAAAYAEAKAAAPQVTTYGAYRIALTRFGNRFQDEHLGIGPARGAPPLGDVREAGLWPLWRDGAFVVARADARYGAQASALEGATIVACDGRAVAPLFRERVLSWRGRPAIEADWYRWAPILLVDYGPPTPKAPSRCRFRGANGRTVELPLVWAPIAPAAVRARQDSLTALPVRPLALARLDEGRTLWVDLPTFAVDGERDVAAMHGLIDSLAAELRRNRDWRLLVFDLRGNSGGSSIWGDEIAAAVFGKPWVDAADAWLDDGVYAEWRVSPHNVEAVHGLVKQTEERHGRDSDEAAQARAFADSMSAALARGARLYADAPMSRRDVPRPPAVQVPGRIVVVTSASCFSACLDFLDRLRLHPAVVQVGQTTGVDTDYMENWGRTLPSGLTQIGHPMKVYRNRRRANNEAYTPKVRYAGDLADTPALRRWILASYAKW